MNYNEIINNNSLKTFNNNSIPNQSVFSNVSNNSNTTNKANNLVPNPVPVQPVVPNPVPVQPMVPNPVPVQPLIVPNPVPVQPMVPNPVPVQPLVPNPVPVQPMVPNPVPVQPINNTMPVYTNMIVRNQTGAIIADQNGSTEQQQPVKKETLFQKIKNFLDKIFLNSL